MGDNPKDAPATHARIETLRLRVPGMGGHTARAVAAAVAQRLALRAGELGSVAAAGETARVRVRASASMSTESLAEKIAGEILRPADERRGRR